MRYRRLNVRHTVVLRAGPTWPFGDLWHGDRLRLLVTPRWRPDADTCETAAGVEITVDLAGINEDEVDVLLFDDVVVVEGERRIPSGDEDAVYHAAAIRQGPFRAEVALPAPVDLDRVEARYDRGLLRITLPRRGAAR
jgi:HSP20 family protein